MIRSSLILPIVAVRLISDSYATEKNMSDVKAVLLDADGVIQKANNHFRETVAALSDDHSKFDILWKEIMSAEHPCLTSQCDFIELLNVVLIEWGNLVSRDEFLSAWTAIDPNADVLDLVSKIRANGIPVVLTSNQERYRANFMANVLNYNSHFDRLFFSCNLGVMKPAPEYFAKVLNEIAVSPSQALFVDDNANLVKEAEIYGIVARQFDLNSESVENLQEIFSTHKLV